VPKDLTRREKMARRLRTKAARADGAGLKALSGAPEPLRVKTRLRPMLIEPSILQPTSYRLRRPVSSRTAGRFRPTLLGAPEALVVRRRTLTPQAAQALRRDGRRATTAPSAWQTNRLSNGLLEATGSLIQAAKRRTRRYRLKGKMIAIIYLIAGKLPLPEIHAI